MLNKYVQKAKKGKIYLQKSSEKRRSVQAVMQQAKKLTLEPLL